MKNVCIELPFSCPYDEPLMVNVSPVFTPPPESDAWGDWLFGPDESSLVDLNFGRKLTVIGTPPGPIEFTPISAKPQSYPYGLSSEYGDQLRQTIIVAFRRPDQNATIAGTLSASGSASYGSGINWAASGGGQAQFAKRLGSQGTQAQQIAVPGDIIIAAMVDTQALSLGYILGIDIVLEVTGNKILGEEKTVGFGNRYNSTSSYLESPDLLAAQIYPTALGPSAVREKMERLLRRIRARSG